MPVTTESSWLCYQLIAQLCNVSVLLQVSTLQAMEVSALKDAV